MASACLLWSFRPLDCLQFAFRTGESKLRHGLHRACHRRYRCHPRPRGDRLRASKAVFKEARQRAGLRAPTERRGGVDWLTVEEELRFLDQAYGQDGRTGLMSQTLLETGARVSELVQLKVEDVSLAERMVTIRQGKGGKRREVPIRRDLAQLLRLHIGTRRAGPLFASRQQGTGPTPHVLTRQRVGQIVRAVARHRRDQQTCLPAPASAYRRHPVARAGHGHHRSATFSRP